MVNIATTLSNYILDDEHTQHVLIHARDIGSIRLINQLVIVVSPWPT
jgi:hypothetical protein